MQPIKFNALLKPTLWGGDRIVPFKQLDEKLENVGESWEVSGVEGHETTVYEGPYKGWKLNHLVAELKEQLVGKANYERFGDEFPLLIKFIDARDDLSIQVHPTDEIARRQGKTRGKTEMWYLMESAPDARLYSGLKKRITPEQYKEMVEDHTICDALAQYSVKEGDCFFLPAGRIHAIGTGCFLAEIQQTSDVTYRIYDFDRRDSDGNRRELHTELAAESIDYRVAEDYRTHYTPAKDEGVELVSCNYFTTAVYDLENPMTLDYEELDSFVVLIALKGEATLTCDDGSTVGLRQGETLLVPASCKRISVSGKIKFLETFV